MTVSGASGNHNRFLIVVGVARYRQLPEAQQLPEVRSDVTRMVALFGERLGYQPVLSELSRDPTAADVRSLVSEWFHSRERCAEDLVVLYFAGHGTTTSTGTHYLCTTDYEEANPAATSVRTADLLEWLDGTPVQRLLVILDTCESGQGTGDLSALARALASAATMNRPAGFYFIASARPHESAFDGVFSEACERAFHEERWGGTTQPYLHPDALVEAVNASTAPLQVATSASSHVTGFPEFLPNPRFDDRAVQGLDVETLRRLRVAPAELKAHWSPRSRGVEFEAQPGWYFTGRHAALRELVAWLTAPEGDGRGRVVTGQPGSGKSAVLARLVLLCDPDTRRRTPLEGVPADTIPPEHAVDLAIHARGKTLHQLTDALAEGSGVPRKSWGADGQQSAEERAALLVAALGARLKRLAVVVDALDEAAEPASVASHLLRPLMALPNLRLLVGTRVTGIAALGASSHVLDLDRPQYVERVDLVAYVQAQLLCPDDREAHTPYRGRPDLAAIVADAVADSAFPNFLVARMVSQNLRAAAEPVDIHTRGWRKRLPTSVGQAFHEYLGRFEADEERVRHILTPLAFAEGTGLPWDNLWAPLASALWGRGYDDGDVSWVLERAGAFVTEQNAAGRSTYRLFHEALAENFRETNRGRAAEVHRRFARTLMEHTPRSVDGRWDWLRAHPYVRAHLATHAAAAGEIDVLLEDPLFLLAAEPDGLLRALPRVSRATGIAGAYRRAVHNVRARPLAEAASYLQLAASEQNQAWAESLAALPLQQTWMPLWAYSRTSPHRLLRGHEAAVNSVAVGELDGRPVIVSGGLDGTVRVWDLTSGTPLLEPLRGHKGGVSSVAIGELNNRPIIVSSDNSAVRVWDLASGTPLPGGLRGREGRVLSVAVGEREGRPAIVSAGIDGTVRVWDLASGTPLLERRADAHSVAVIELDSRPVIVFGDHHTVEAWDLSPRMPLLHLHFPSNSITSSGVTAVAAAESAGRLVVVWGGADGAVRVWDLASGTCVLEPLRGHAGKVRSVALERSGYYRVIVSGGLDGIVRVWDLESGTPLLEPLRGHESAVNSVAVGKLDYRPVIVSGGIDGTVRVWDLASGMRTLESPRGHEGGVNSVAVGQSGGQHIVVSGGFDSTVRVWSLASGMPLLEPLRGHEGTVRSVAVGEIGHRTIIVSGGFDGTVRVWDLASGTPLLEPLHGHEGGVKSVAVGQLEGRHVVITAGIDSTVRTWDLASGTLVLRPLRGHVGTVAVGKLDGRPVVVSGGFDSIMRVWDLASGTPLLEPLHGHEGALSSVALGELDGEPVIVSGGIDRTVRVWEFASGTLRLERLQGHGATSVAFGEIGGRAVIVSGDIDGTVRVWSRIAHVGWSVDIVINMDSRVRSVALAPASQLVVGTVQGLVALNLNSAALGRGLPARSGFVPHDNDR